MNAKLSSRMVRRQAVTHTAYENFAELGACLMATYMAKRGQEGKAIQLLQRYKLQHGASDAVEKLMLLWQTN